MNLNVTFSRFALLFLVFVGKKSELKLHQKLVGGDGQLLHYTTKEKHKLKLLGS